MTGSLGVVGRTIQVDADRFQAKMRAAGPRTADDVSITKDGRRLDSRQSVFTWLAELEAEALEASSPKLG
jgi:hypothetical protein